MQISARHPHLKYKSPEKSPCRPRCESENTALRRLCLSLVYRVRGQKAVGRTAEYLCAGVIKGLDRRR